jgi:hypothetical protein
MLREEPLSLSRLPLMAKFYLLPPRALIAQKLLATLGIVEPQSPLLAELAETIGRAVEATGAFVVYRDDLPLHESMPQSLMDGFGAEVGDEVVEILADLSPRRSQIRRPPLAA